MHIHIYHLVTFNQQTGLKARRSGGPALPQVDQLHAFAVGPRPWNSHLDLEGKQNHVLKPDVRPGLARSLALSFSHTQMDSWAGLLGTGPGDVKTLRGLNGVSWPVRARTQTVFRTNPVLSFSTGSISHTPLRLSGLLPPYYLKKNKKILYVCSRLSVSGWIREWPPA